MKKTIALVANTTWNISNFRLNVIKALHKNGFEVVVIAPIDQYITYQKDFPYVRQIELKHLSRKGSNPIQDLWLLIELIRIYRRESIDLTLHYTIKPNLYGSIAAHLARVANISVITGLGYTFIHNGLINKLSKFLYRITLRYNQKVVFENNDDRLLFIEDELVKSAQAISMKGCGVDTTHFSPVPNTNTSGKLVFTFVGRLLYDKGIKEFIEAAIQVHAKEPNAEFWILGEIDAENPAAITEEELSNWTSHDYIQYKGFIQDVREYVKLSDCVVLPSYREAIPRAIQEGMAMAKPVISTDTAGCREAIEEGKNGYLVTLKSADSLADAMVKFCSLTEPEAKAMGEYGRQKALREFDDRIIANHFVKIITEVLDTYRR